MTPGCGQSLKAVGLGLEASLPERILFAHAEAVHHLAGLLRRYVSTRERQGLTFALGPRNGSCTALGSVAARLVRDKPPGTDGLRPQEWDVPMSNVAVDAEIVDAIAELDRDTRDRPRQDAII